MSAFMIGIGVASLVYGLVAALQRRSWIVVAWFTTLGAADLLFGYIYR